MEDEDLKLCNNCKRNISSKTFLLHSVHCERHITLCNFCNEPFPKKDLEKHLGEYHSKTYCEKCNLEMEKWRLGEHKNTCSKRLVPCEFCELEVPFDGLVEHSEACGSRSEKCHKCFHYVLIRDQKEHPRVCEPFSQLFKEPLSKRLTTCSFCGLVLPVDNLNAHITDCRVQMEMCAHCGIPVRISKFEEHRRVCRNVEFPCDLCGNFVNESTYLEHYSLCLLQYKEIEKNKSSSDVDIVSYPSPQRNALDHYISCEFCEDQVPKSVYDSHAEICGSKLEICKQCHHRVELKNKIRHLSVCKPVSKQLGTCRNCKQQVSWVEMNMHEAICQVSSGYLDFKEEYSEQPGRTVNKTSSRNERNNKMDNIETYTECEFCKRVLPLSSLDEHHQACPENFYTCDLCSSRVPNKEKDIHDLVSCGSKNSANNLSYAKLLTEPDAIPSSRKNNIEKFKECAFCHERLPDLIFDEHLKNCEERPYNCSDCQKPMAFKEKSIHLSKCRGNMRPKYFSTDPETEEILVGATAAPPRNSTYSAYVGLKVEVCPNCKSKVPEHKYDEHLIMCFSNMKSCYFCEEEFPSDKEKDHMEKCKMKNQRFRPQSKKKNKGKNKNKTDESSTSFRLSSFLPKSFSRNKNVEGIVLVPCEFCTELFPMDVIIEHQSGCRPDLMSFPTSDDSCNREECKAHLDLDRPPLYDELPESIQKSPDYAKIIYKDIPTEQRMDRRDRKPGDESSSARIYSGDNSARQYSTQVQRSDRRDFYNNENLSRPEDSDVRKRNLRIFSGKNGETNRVQEQDQQSRVQHNAFERKKHVDSKEVMRFKYSVANIEDINDSSDEDGGPLTKSIKPEYQPKNTSTIINAFPSDTQPINLYEKPDFKAIGAERAEKRNIERPVFERNSRIRNANLIPYDQDEKIRASYQNYTERSFSSVDNNDIAHSLEKVESRETGKDYNRNTVDKNLGDQYEELNANDSKKLSKREIRRNLAYTSDYKYVGNEISGKITDKDFLGKTDEEMFDAKNQETFGNLDRNIIDTEETPLGTDEETLWRRPKSNTGSSTDMEDVFFDADDGWKRTDSQAPTECSSASQHKGKESSSDDDDIDVYLQMLKNDCSEFDAPPGLSEGSSIGPKQKSSSFNCDCNNQICYCSIAKQSLSDEDNVSLNQRSMEAQRQKATLKEK